MLPVFTAAVSVKANIDNVKKIGDRVMLFSSLYCRYLTVWYVIDKVV